MVNTSSQNNMDTSTTAPKKAGSAKRKVATRKSSTTAAARARKRNGMTSKIYRQGRNAMETAYDAASGLGSSLPKMPSNLHLRERGQSVYSMVESKPLIFGAVGLGVGMVLAALIPSMQQRNSGRNRGRRGRGRNANT